MQNKKGKEKIGYEDLIDTLEYIGSFSCLNSNRETVREFQELYVEFAKFINEITLGEIAIIP